MDLPRDNVTLSRYETVTKQALIEAWKREIGNFECQAQ